MRKKIVLLLSFVLALTVSLGILSACTKKVTVELNKTEITVETGKTQTIKATTSTGVEVKWSSSDESVATVNGGKITGVKVGTAKITATAVKGKGKATCEVTVKDPVVFKFFDKDGKDVTKGVEVDRDGDPVELTVTTSDNSAVTRWTSSDEEIITVENGVITALSDGEARVTAFTPTGQGTVNVTVIDTFVDNGGTKYEITDRASNTNWYYFTDNPEFTTILKNEARYKEPAKDSDEEFIGGVTFGFDGGNWNKGVQLIWAKAPWEWQGEPPILYFKATIESDFEGAINLNGTRVHLKEGTNKVQVRYVPSAGTCTIDFGTAKDGRITSGTITISNWGMWDVDYDTYNVPLAAPSFELEDNGNITITDNNEEDVQKYGIEEYIVGLFVHKEDTNPVFMNILNGTTGVFDISKFEDDGEYYVKVKAVGNPFYTDSDWSVSEEKFKVEKHTVSYDVPEGGGSDAITSSGWYYFVVDNGETKPTEARYEDGTLTFSTPYLGWAFYSTELLRHYPTIEKDSVILVSMKINASHAGTITLSGVVSELDGKKYETYELKKGENIIYFKVTQKDTSPTISVMFGKWMPNTNDKGVVDFPALADGEENYTFILSDVTVINYQATNLEAVSGMVDATNKKISVTDKNEAGVKNYELGFFKNGTLMYSVSIGKDEDGSFNDEAFNNGTYELRLRAIVTDIRYVSADWTVIGDYEVANEGGATYPVIFGGDLDGDTPTGNALTNPNTWYYWNDQNWDGATTDVSTAKMEKGVLTIAYEVSAGSSGHGIQIYYKDPSITGDNKLTLKIKSEEEIDVTINGANIHLNKGDNYLTVYYTQGGSYSFSMQVKVDASEVTENILEISELNYEAYTYKILNAPTLSVAEDGTITITDSNLAENVAGYVLGYFKAGAGNPLAKITVKNGDKLDYSMVDGGDYILKVMALAADNKGYKESGWSAGFDYKVDNPEGAHYELDTLFGGGDAAANPGRWGIWADPQGWTGAWVTVSEATYAKGEIKVSFTSAGKSAWGLQFNYVNPNYVAGTKYTFDIVASADMDIQVENGGAEVTHLKEGEKVTLTGGTDASFYIQVNIDGGVGGTITISNIQWN